MTSTTAGAAGPPVNRAVARLGIHKEFFHRTIACFRPEEGSFQPRPDMLSVNGQILHVTAAIELFLSGLFVAFKRLRSETLVSLRGEGEAWIGLSSGFTDMGWTEQASLEHEASGPARSMEAALAAFDGTMDIAASVFSELTSEDMVQPLAQNPLDLRTPQHVLEILLDHTAHHRGALAQYARLLGHDPSIPYFDMSEAKHEAGLTAHGHAAAAGRT